MRSDAEEGQPLVKCAAAIVRDDRVLLIRKRGTTALISPGGKLEAGESHLDCLRRELSEELGASLASATYFGTYEDVSVFDQGRSITIVVYICDIAGDPQPHSEIEALEWLPVTCLPGGESTFQRRVIPDIARASGRC
ncbi:NUDIX domain-containing protein [Actinomyces lilanjuaniae]|uniref:NUDIX domain-containing protein n=1 Tax=Actinomyces lilanjuaniae TaxID=2321394 RepID=A0ABN5PMC1_9ACTO|nr:NUDIX domain-containing protein [Actinomyces lilanjuaniae]AYD89430.1 NUDIX domain-containing protein [Actinomyces lilanjuaniae]